MACLSSTRSSPRCAHESERARETPPGAACAGLAGAQPARQASLDCAHQLMAVLTRRPTPVWAHVHGDLHTRTPLSRALPWALLHGWHWG